MNRVGFATANQAQNDVFGCRDFIRHWFNVATMSCMKQRSFGNYLAISGKLLYMKLYASKEFVFQHFLGGYRTWRMVWTVRHRTHRNQSQNWPSPPTLAGNRSSTLKASQKDLTRINWTYLVRRYRYIVKLPSRSASEVTKIRRLPDGSKPIISLSIMTKKTNRSAT